MDEEGRFAWPKGLLGMLVLVAAVEPFVAKYATRWAHTIVLDWRDTGKSVTRQAPGCGVLAFGSSMSKFGVLPRVIEARTGLRAYNFALLNGPPPASFFSLKRSLEVGARPSVVLVDFDPHRLQEGPQSAIYNYPWAELLRPSESSDLARRTDDAGLFGRLMVQTALPSMRRRHEIRTAILVRINGYTGALDDLGAAFNSTKPAFARNRVVNRGAIVNPKSRPGQGGPRTVFEKPQPWLCHPVNASYVKRFLGLCAGHDIAVIWLLPPVSPSQQTHRDRTHSEDRYVDFVRELAGRYPNVTVVDGRTAGYPASVYVDHVHLDRTGAVALSDALASLINDRPGLLGTRWRLLPRFQGDSAEDGVEDLSQSELALKAARDSVRQ
jgi:hypothetical protein